MYIIFIILPKYYNMNYQDSKIEPIFRFYLDRGFEHSLQKVADAVHITKKTLFNRYLSKENLEFCIVNYWQKKSNERIVQRVEFTNNSVEKLMMFLLELQYCKNFEPHFFQKMKELFLKKKGSNYPHIDKLEEIFKMADEIMVMFEGRQYGPFPYDAHDIETIGLMMAGAHAQEDKAPRAKGGSEA